MIIFLLFQKIKNWKKWREIRCSLSLWAENRILSLLGQCRNPFYQFRDGALRVVAGPCPHSEHRAVTHLGFQFCDLQVQFIQVLVHESDEGLKKRHKPGIEMEILTSADPGGCLCDSTMRTRTGAISQDEIQPRVLGPGPLCWAEWGWAAYGALPAKPLKFTGEGNPQNLYPYTHGSNSQYQDCERSRES